MISHLCRLSCSSLLAFHLLGLLAHTHDTPDTVTSMHIVECLVDLVKRLPVSDELVNLESAL